MSRYVVRYGSMRTLGVFTPPRADVFRRGDRVVVRTDRGQEVGEVLCEATEAALAQLQEPPRGQILRTMNAVDEEAVVRGRVLIRQEFESCKRLVSDLRLEMDLIDVEHLLGGERIVFYYLAENRVDFRELVKRLQQEFSTRIEMRQVGVRDEARLLADYGDCGKPVCCNTHLSTMPPVSMKMAKLQRATLDPSKISGRCGRLKCCLRYEYDTYLDLQKELPPPGSTILTRNGRFKVIAQEILAAQLLVEAEDRRRIVVPASEVLTVLPAPKRTGPGKGSPNKGPSDAAADAPSVEAPPAEAAPGVAPERAARPSRGSNRNPSPDAADEGSSLDSRRESIE